MGIKKDYIAVPTIEGKGEWTQINPDCFIHKKYPICKCGRSLLKNVYYANIKCMAKDKRERKHRHMPGIALKWKNFKKPTDFTKEPSLEDELIRIANGGK